MKILKNESLKKHTTVQIGGSAGEFVIPESADELLSLIVQRDPKYFIGGGSNLLIADREFDLVVSLCEFDRSIKDEGNGRFTVGASAHLQTFINHINEAGYGGIEYLFSVPGLVGGAIAMNAGRGKKYNQAISDYLISAEVIRDGEVVSVQREECGFEYRDSIFKHNNDIIVSAVFEFPEKSREETKAAKEERIRYCREKQDNSKPNFGSVFREKSPKIMEHVRKKELHKGGIRFSGKTANWILNNGGTFEEAEKLIKKVEWLHKIAGQKVKAEVILWK